MAPQGDHPRERAEGRVPGDARALPGCSAEPRPGLAHSPCRELSLSLGGALMWARKEASSEATPAQLCFHTAASESPRPPSAAAGLPDPRTRRGKGTARLSLPETTCSPCPGTLGCPLLWEETWEALPSLWLVALTSEHMGSTRTPAGPRAPLQTPDSAGPGPPRASAFSRASGPLPGGLWKGWARVPPSGLSLIVY